MGRGSPSAAYPDCPSVLAKAARPRASRCSCSSCFITRSGFPNSSNQNRLAWRPSDGATLQCQCGNFTLCHVAAPARAYLATIEPKLGAHPHHGRQTIVSTKGQVILPKAIRQLRHWEAGIRLLVEETPDGVSPKAAPVFAPTGPEDVAGMLPYRGPPKTLEEMDAAIAAEVKRRRARGRTEWVMRRGYRFSRERILAALTAFAGLPRVTLEEPALAAEALEWMRAG